MPSVAEQVVEWVSTQTWDASQAFLSASAGDLLTDEGEGALARLVADNPGEQVLELHLELLRAARGGGIEEAYRALQASMSRQGLADLIVAWVGTQSWEEARAYFDQHEEALSTDEAEAAAAVLAHDNPDQPDLLVHRGLLAICRLDGPDKAFDLLLDPERLQRLVTGAAATNDPAWALPRARVLAGLFPDEPEAQFVLAVLALRVGDRDEAERSILHCARSLGPAQGPALARRLGDMADAEPEIAPGLWWLSGLVGPGGGSEAPNR